MVSEECLRYNIPKEGNSIYNAVCSEVQNEILGCMDS